MTTRLGTKLLVALATTVVATLALEGLYSTLVGRSLLRPDLSHSVVLKRDDADRLEAAKRTAGPFARDEDPLVAFRVKASRAHPILGVLATTNAHGQRARAGPPAQEGATKIVLLGDSVAFGFGLADDQVLAHRLEERLAAAMATGSPRPVVQTIASPGWTGRNAIRYLKDHLQRLKPDVVLYLPVSNDLDDPIFIDEAGHTVYAAVPGDAGPHSSNAEYRRFIASLEVPTAPETFAQVAAVGRSEAVTHVLKSGITPESARRWASWLDDLRDLEARLKRRDRRLAVALFSDDYFLRLFEAKAAKHVPDVALIPGFRDYADADKLEKDSHPNAAFVDALAQHLASFLAEQGWIHDLNGDRLPDLPTAWASRRAERMETAAAESWAQETRALQGQFLRDTIDLERGLGIHQIYGGVEGDGFVGTGFLAALSNTGGGQIVLRGDRPRFRDSLYPLQLTISANGAKCGTLRLTSPTADDAAFEQSFALPASVAGDRYLDIAVRASNWISRRHRGVTRLESFQLRSLHSTK